MSFHLSIHQLIYPFIIYLPTHLSIYLALTFEYSIIHLSFTYQFIYPSTYHSLLITHLSIYLSFTFDYSFIHLSFIYQFIYPFSFHSLLIASLLSTYQLICLFTYHSLWITPLPCHDFSLLLTFTHTIIYLFIIYSTTYSSSYHLLITSFINLVFT